MAKKATYAFLVLCSTEFNMAEDFFMASKYPESWLGWCMSLAITSKFFPPTRKNPSKSSFFPKLKLLEYFISFIDFTVL
jgi:hypothetical protein